MMFEVQFRDRTSTLIEPLEGERLKQMLLTQKTPRNIELNGELYNTTQIVAVKRAVGSTVDKPDYDKPVLTAGATSGCRGVNSIARELMRIASQQKNFKLLADKKWRATQTAVLKESGRKFCDSAKGVCECPPVTSRV